MELKGLIVFLLITISIIGMCTYLNIKFYSDNNYNLFIYRIKIN